MPRMKLSAKYKKLGKMSIQEITELICLLTSQTVPMLERHDKEMKSVFAEYILMVVSIDGKVHMNEYCLVKPLISAAIGKECSYAEAERFVAKNGYDEEETRNRFRAVLDDLNKTDPDLRYNMIVLAMYISAIDDDVSLKEKEFIESLI